MLRKLWVVKWSSTRYTIVSWLLHFSVAVSWSIVYTWCWRDVGRFQHLSSKPAGGMIVSVDVCQLLWRILCTASNLCLWSHSCYKKTARCFFAL